MENSLSVVLSILFGLISFQATGQKLEISHLTGNFYVYTTYTDYEGSPFPSNSMYLVTNDGVVMFDTPWDPAQFQPLLDSIEERHGKKVVLCIATHFHADRTAGLEFLNRKYIPTYTSKQTWELCKANDEMQAANYFTKDTTFSIGGYELATFYPGAGHSPDNIVIWIAKGKVLYGGCFVKSTESKGLGNMSHANVDAWEVSVKKTIKKFPKPQYVIPGHFGWASNKSLEHTLKLVKEAKKKSAE